MIEYIYLHAEAKSLENHMYNPDMNNNENICYIVKLLSYGILWSVAIVGMSVLGALVQIAA